MERWISSATSGCLDQPRSLPSPILDQFLQLTKLTETHGKTHSKDSQGWPPHRIKSEIG